MKIFEYLKSVFRGNKNNNTLFLDSPKNLYQNLVSTKQIQNILNNIPEDLTQMEKAYYTYLELGKILKEDPKFVFSGFQDNKRMYHNKINKNFYGICKSISELYVSLLRDKKIGIHADLVKRNPDSDISHIDTILKVDDKFYIANLIADLSRIKTSRRINNFCYDLTRTENLEITEDINKQYLYRLESHYGKIDCLTRQDMEKLDKKLNYSFFIPEYTHENDRGIYTEDTINILSDELNNPNLFKQYVLKNREIPKDYYLQYKLEYIFENINNFTNFNINDKNNNIDYLENIRYYMKIVQKVLDPEDMRRIKAYAITYKDDLEKIISIIKLMPPQDSEKVKNNVYYLFSPTATKYVKQSPKSLNYILDNYQKYNLKIVGLFDKYNPQDIDELEL